LSREAGEIAIRANTAWLTLQSEIEASQKLLNALHGLSLVRGDQRAAKLEELKSRYEGTQVEGLLDRLFD
jgi:serine/threonine protein phosphatase 1